MKLTAPTRPVRIGRAVTTSRTRDVGWTGIDGFVALQPAYFAHHQIEFDFSQHLDRDVSRTSSVPVKRTRSRRSFIRNGVEQLESRVLPGGFLDLLAGAAIASNLDLLPEEYLVPEEIEADSDGATLCEKPTNASLQAGLPLAAIDREPQERRAKLAQPNEDIDVAPLSRATTNSLVAASFVDSFFTSNQFVDTSLQKLASPSPSRPLSTPSSSFSSPISQLGAGVGSGSGQGYNVTGAELPQAIVGSTSVAASSFPGWMMGEGEGATSSSGTSSASGSGSGGGAATGSTSTPTPPPPDPCLGIPAPSITIDPVPIGVDEMDVITISGTVTDGYLTGFEMGDQWMTVEKQVSFTYPTQTWSIEGFYLDDGAMPITVSAGYVCGQTSASDTITVQNVAPSIDSASGSTINEGDEAVLTVQYSDATNGYGYSGEELTLTVDWGDGNLSTYTDDRRSTGDGGSGAGLGAAAGSYIPLREHSFHHVYQDDAYNDSPPNLVANYPVTVTIDDGTDTDVENTTVVVNNVAPAVTITSITPIDSVLPDDGGVDWQVDETEGFIVRGTITDPGVLDTFPVASLDVDLDFDGAITSGETFGLSLVNVADGVWDFEATVAQTLDDGPSPGNATLLDDLALKVRVEDDDTGVASKASTAEIHNVAPRLLDTPSMAFNMDSSGALVSVSVAGDWLDAGNEDYHDVIISIDGVETTFLYPPGISDFNITLPITTIPQTVQVTVQDDDGGQDQRQAAQRRCELADGLHANRGRDIFGTQVTVRRGGRDVRVWKWGGEVDFRATARNGGEFDARLCEFQLWARGAMELVVMQGGNERVIAIPHTLPGSGQMLDPNTLRQDSPTIRFTGPAFTTQDLPGHSIPVTDAAAYNRMLQIIALHGTNGITVEYRVRLTFQARVRDRLTRANVSVVSYTWSLEGPVNNPRIVTSLMPRP